MNFSFTRLSLFLVICLVCVSTAMASSTCPSQPPSSVNYGDNYHPGPVDTPNGPPAITCVTENLQFSQFGFSSGGTAPVNANEIGVTVVDNQLPGPGSGFNFTPAFSDGPGSSTDAKISFLVTALNGTTIDDLFIHFNGSVSNPANGASTSYSETYCTTSFSTGCNVFQVNNPPSQLDQHIYIPNATQLWITKDFTARGGNGSASISTIENTFSSPVPEPREIGLLILAMVGLVFAHRRFKTSVN